MADANQTLIDALNRLTAVLAPINDFANSWQLREQNPGLYSKLPVAVPFRPAQNQTVIMAVGVNNVFSQPLLEGSYDITADADCFITLNMPASANGGYLIRQGLAYGGLRLVARDIVNAICPTAGAGTVNLYLMRVE